MTVVGNFPKLPREEKVTALFSETIRREGAEKR